MTATLRQSPTGISPTRLIYNTLKPYWEAKVLNDQDWALVLACIRDIELYKKEKAELEAFEQKIVEMI